LEATARAACRAVVARDLLIAARRRSDVLTTFFFFVIVVSLFPLGVGPQPDTLREIAPGVVWVAALLAAMLSLARMFGADYADGTLEQLVLTPQPLTLLVLSKVLAHWLTTGLPLVLMAPLLGLQFDLPGDALATMLVSLLIGTPALSLMILPKRYSGGPQDKVNNDPPLVHWLKIRYEKLLLSILDKPKRALQVPLAALVISVVMIPFLGEEFLPHFKEYDFLMHWVEKPGTRRRRFYRLTREGRKVLAAQRDNWLDFVEAVARITGVRHA